MNLKYPLPELTRKEVHLDKKLQPTRSGRQRIMNRMVQDERIRRQGFRIAERNSQILRVVEDGHQRAVHPERPVLVRASLEDDHSEREHRPQEGGPDGDLTGRGELVALKLLKIKNPTHYVA